MSRGFTEPQKQGCNYFQLPHRAWPPQIKRYALHRKVSKRKPPYPVFGPYHSFLRADAEPLLPGRAAELRFALLPTSVLIRKNHRLRIAIAGHDSDTFARTRPEGHP